MDARERRDKITAALRAAKEPVAAAVLAAEFGVSRQVIVGDIALLRAAGVDVSATPRGYIVTEPKGVSGAIVCIHGKELLEAELCAIVDHGCTVEDVVVEHPLYGEFTGRLSITSRYDVKQYMKKVNEESATPLSALTGGIHIHHITAPDDEALMRVREDLSKLGVIYE